MSEWGDKLLTEADNARLRAENDKLLVELTDLRLNSCPSCGIKVENEELRELIADIWRVIVREYPRGGFPDMGRFERRMRDMKLEVE